MPVKAACKLITVSQKKEVFLVHFLVSLYTSLTIRLYIERQIVLSSEQLLATTTFCSCICIIPLHGLFTNAA